MGRLDLQTSGLLVLANDGELVNRMMHPSTGLDREYAVRVDGRLDDELLGRLVKGVLIDGQRHAFTDVRYYDGSGRNHWYHAVLMDGKNHAVRKLFEQVGHPVSRLKRVRYGPVVLPSTLRRGRYAELNERDPQNPLLPAAPAPNLAAPPEKGNQGVAADTLSQAAPCSRRAKEIVNRGCIELAAGRDFPATRLPTHLTRSSFDGQGNCAVKAPTTHGRPMPARLRPWRRR